jgi:hypothetical protein
MSAPAEFRSRAWSTYVTVPAVTAVSSNSPTQSEMRLRSTAIHKSLPAIKLGGGAVSRGTGSVHDRRLLAPVAAMLAGGGIQPDLFGEMTSDPTIWRVFRQMDERTVDGLRQARAEARCAVWTAADALDTTVLDVDSPSW